MALHARAPMTPQQERTSEELSSLIGDYAECLICHKRWRVEYFGVPLEVRVVSAELDCCPNCRPEKW
jgi:hypothetical protein